MQQVKSPKYCVHSSTATSTAAAVSEPILSVLMPGCVHPTHTPLLSWQSRQCHSLPLLRPQGTVHPAGPPAQLAPGLVELAAAETIAAAAAAHGQSMKLLLPVQPALLTVLSLYALTTCLPGRQATLQPHNLSAHSTSTRHTRPAAASKLLLDLTQLFLQLLQLPCLWRPPSCTVELPDGPPLQLTMQEVAAVVPAPQDSPVHHLQLPGMDLRVTLDWRGCLLRWPLLTLLLLLLLLLLVPALPALLPLAFCEDVCCSSVHIVIQPALRRLDTQLHQTPTQLQQTQEQRQDKTNRSRPQVAPATDLIADTWEGNYCCNPLCMNAKPRQACI